jgi:hypothetical protein
LIYCCRIEKGRKNDIVDVAPGCMPFDSYIEVVVVVLKIAVCMSRK